MSSNKRFPHRRMRRTGLFLVRVWTERTTGDTGGGSRPLCRGRVQRVVDGESQRFDNWEELADVLVELLGSSMPGDSRYSESQD